MSKRRIWKTQKERIGTERTDKKWNKKLKNKGKTLDKQQEENKIRKYINY